MNIKEELKNAIIRDQKIHLSANLTRDELIQIANYLQYHFNMGDIPHWRPIAFGLHHHEDTFMKSLQKSCPLLGDSFQTIADRIADKVPVGEFYVPPKDVWGYTQHGDITPMSNEWADTFGFNGTKQNGVGKKVELRRRDIFMGDASQYNFAFCRDILDDKASHKEYYHYTYEVPSEQPNTKFSHYGVQTDQLKPICSDSLTPLHEWHQFRINDMRGFGFGDIRPVFLIIFKWDSGYRTSLKNSEEIIPELRSSFCFCNTDYKLSHLIKVEGVHSNIIDLEFYASDYHEKQLEAVLKRL